jgi:adenosylcobinamide-GDP ribazoletransferase
VTRARPAAVASEIAAAFGFLTRLPVPQRGAAASAPSTGRLLRWSPLVGLVVGLLAGAGLLLASRIGLPVMDAAVLAVGIGVLVTGALHEDGLADVADGFGGGRDRERKLAIMRDSRIGTYGTLALIVGLLLRAATVQALVAENGAWSATGAIVAAATVSRVLMLLPMVLLAPARTDGLAFSLRAVGWGDLGPASLLGLVLGGLAATVAQASPARFAVAVLAAVFCVLALTGLARRQIGGVTGDVVGASQQVADVAVLLALSAA